jgi:hypothetical protein
MAGWQRSQASKSCWLMRWNSSTEALTSLPLSTTLGQYCPCARHARPAREAPTIAGDSTFHAFLHGCLRNSVHNMQQRDG